MSKTKIFKTFRYASKALHWRCKPKGQKLAERLAEACRPAGVDTTGVEPPSWQVKAAAYILGFLDTEPIIIAGVVIAAPLIFVVLSEIAA